MQTALTPMLSTSRCSRLPSSDPDARSRGFLASRQFIQVRHCPIEADQTRQALVNPDCLRQRHVERQLHGKTGLDGRSLQARCQPPRPVAAAFQVISGSKQIVGRLRHAMASLRAGQFLIFLGHTPGWTHVHRMPYSMHGLSPQGICATEARSPRGSCDRLATKLHRARRPAGCPESQDVSLAQSQNGTVGGGGESGKKDPWAPVGAGGMRRQSFEPAEPALDPVAALVPVILMGIGRIVAVPLIRSACVQHLRHERLLDRQTGRMPGERGAMAVGPAEPAFRQGRAGKALHRPAMGECLGRLASGPWLAPRCRTGPQARRPGACRSRALFR